MDLSKFTEKKTGQLVAISGARGATHAFIPDPLPPEWEWPERLWPLLMNAREELARLDGIGRHLPNPRLLLTPMQNREAQRSSSLEGTYATPRQLALFEMSPTDSALEEEDLQAVLEISNYARALRLRSETQERLPISLRLIRLLHEVLLTGVCGARSNPGEFRRGQVQVGSRGRYVPPPLNALPGCLDQLEKYLHKEKNLDPLVEAFLAHYQFEAIHPFSDGNGRVGRLLLSITIQDWCGLSEQWLYMSAFYDRHRDEYIQRLFHVSTLGDWEGWIEFCLRGVVEQAVDTQQRCTQLLALREDYKHRLAGKKHPGRINLILEGLFTDPVATASSIMKRYNITHPTARSDLEFLVELGILNTVQLRQRRQKGYFCEDIIQITYEDAPEV